MPLTPGQLPAPHGSATPVIHMASRRIARFDRYARVRYTGDVGNIVQSIPDELHQRARVAAAQQGRTLKAFVTDAIQTAVEAHEAAEEKRRRR
ncbi:MAG TPA: hypothetical protein VGJ43_13875 [Acidimicrobiales bacterium]